MFERPNLDAGIPAFLIAPHREMAQQLLGAIPGRGSFQILADLKAYPPEDALEVRIRQLKPQVVLIDLATDLAVGIQLTRFLTSLRPPIHVVGVHTDNNPVAILQSLRAGASEFLYSPFDLGIQKEAVTRLRRLVTPEPVVDKGGGFAVAFTSSKPGSGASTLAAQTSFALARMTGKRVLLADGDLTGGTIAFYLKLAPRYSLLDGLHSVNELDGDVWRSLTTPSAGVDILPAPQEPHADPVDASLLRLLLSKAKESYDWVVLDLPTVFQRTSLMGVSGCDMACLVSTAELPSLHLTRKAFSMIDHLGFPREILKLVANRVDKKSDFTLADLGKLFGTKVLAKLNHDYFALHRVVTLGQPLNDGGDLAKSIEALAQQIIDAKQAKKSKNSAEVDSRVMAR